jgi:hypothetical protein
VATFAWEIRAREAKLLQAGDRQIRWSQRRYRTSGAARHEDCWNHHVVQVISARTDV